ncbi:MAG: alpha/beta hydrolase [Planctomyces sp.]|nr:alpha/beta hydrolase [Planctomyces sp.]
MSRLLTLACMFSLVATQSARAEEWRTITPDVIYGHKAGMALTYDVVQPVKSPKGVAVLFMMSGGWVSPWSPPESIVRPAPKNHNLFEKIVDHGYTLIIVRHGSSPYFKVPDAVSDVKLAIRHIRSNAERFHVDPNRIGVCGGSAGGHLSLCLGTMGEDGDPNSSDPLNQVSSRVQAVAAYFPPTDIREYVNHETLSKTFPAIVFPTEEAPGISPLLAVTSDDAPSLLIHGDKDELVPISHSERQKEAMDKVGVRCELIVVKGAAHGFNPEQTQQAEAALIAWFDEHLKAQN